MFFLRQGTEGKLHKFDRSLNNHVIYIENKHPKAMQNWGKKQWLDMDSHTVREISLHL